MEIWINCWIWHFVFNIYKFSFDFLFLDNWEWQNRQHKFALVGFIFHLHPPPPPPKKTKLNNCWVRLRKTQFFLAIPEKKNNVRYHEIDIIKWGFLWSMHKVRDHKTMVKFDFELYLFSVLNLSPFICWNIPVYVS